MNALPEWPADLDHAVPVTRHICRVCHVAQIATAFAPSELRPKPQTQRGKLYRFRPALRCRRCLRQKQRRWYGRTRTWRRYAEEA